MTMVLDGLEQWGGVPVGSQAAYPVPIFGTHWFVDGTNGRDGNPGTSKAEPLQTIQAAVTAQIAYSSGIGDAIWIAPGTYVESITGDLTKVSMIGLGPTPGAVQIAPTASYAYAGKLTNASLRNITFISPDTSLTTLAAVYVHADMTYSVIDDCWFKGGAIGCVDGLQICPQVNTNAWQTMTSSIISNNRFLAGGTKTFQTGINLFADDVQTWQNKKYSTNCRITGNIISAGGGSVEAGIKLNTQKTNNRGMVIDHNYIRADETTSGPRWGIICRSTNGDDQTAQVCFNVIEANDVGIEGFTVSSVFGNMVAKGSATAVGVYGYTA